MRIDNDFKNLLPELTKEEYTDLERDIVKHGILSPIIVWNDTIVDGHNRYAIAQAHRFPDSAIPTKEINFDSKASAMQWIVDNQFAKRNLEKSERMRLLIKIEDQIAKEKSAKSIANLKQNTEASNLTYREDSGETAEIMAKKMGVSKNTYKDMRTIIEHGTADQIARMDKGGKGNGVSAIAKEIKGMKISEVRKCKECGKVLPISHFDWVGGKPRHVCRKCRVQRDAISRNERRLKGTDGFYVDSVEERIWTPEEITEQMKRDFDSFIDNLKIELDVHRDEIKTHEAMVDETIEIFVETLRLMKGVYR